MPGHPLLDVVEVKAGALVVRRIKPEHAGKCLLCFPGAAQAPQAKAVAMKTAEKRSFNRPSWHNI